MVLLRALVVLLAVSGCSESLFGAHGGTRDGSGGDDDASVPDTCPSGCIADAAANFDGTAGGADGHWRYLGDKRDRTWVPMASAASAMVGEASNRIERCADKPSSAACQGLPGALLVTSSGTSSASDPALEYTIPDARVIRLALRAYIPGDSVAQRVRLYRNSREDVLFTASASPGATVEHTITVDALAGDRFLVALEPTGGQGGTAALQFFVIDANKTFPSTCQMATTFEDKTITGSTIEDLCHRSNLTAITNTQPAPPAIGTGPFSYQGNSVYLEHLLYLLGDQPLDRGDSTIQFWVQSQMPFAQTEWLFSDIDPSNAHGLGIRLDMSAQKLVASIVSSTTPVTYTDQSINYPNPGKWHFVRVVHAAGMVTLCLDGTRMLSAPLAGPATPGRAPTLGRNGPADSVDEFFGTLDDVRVFSDVLPCNE
jgi:hypothetical protein